MRFPLSDGVPGPTEILAGFGDAGTDVGDVFDIHSGIQGVNNFDTMPHGTTQDWEFCTRVNDIAIDPNNPRVAYVAVGPGNITFYHQNFGAWCVSDTVWTHIWGGNETGSGAKTVGISPADYSHLYLGSVGQEFFRADIAPAPHPEIASDASYPLLAGAIDATLVFAVQIASSDTIRTATVDLGGLGLVETVLQLLDDGKGEDVEVNDGIFTSERFAATLADTGAYFVRVFAQATDGGYDQRDVAVPVVANHAKFIDVSKDTGDLYGLMPAHPDTMPYSSIYFNTDADGVSGFPAMIVSFDDGAMPPLLLQRYDLYNGAPQFASRMAGEPLQWIETNLPPGSRAICYADFDNDRNTSNHSDNDFFICNPNSGGRLYRSHFAQGIPLFKDATDTLFGAQLSELDGAITAAWGDFNGDGFDDLFVATTEFVGSVKSLTGPPPASYAIKIFKNLGGRGFAKLATSGFSGSANICLSGTWADMDQDGDQDLVILNYASWNGFSLVMENFGKIGAGGEYLLGQSNWTFSGQWGGGGTSDSVIDYDHDDYPDLLLTEAFGDLRALVLQNNFGWGGDKQFTPVVLSGGRDWTGAAVADFDLNGQDDVLLLPASGQPELFMGERLSHTLVPTYEDLSFTVGLRRGASSGALAADFTGDHDVDLFLGRVAADEFLYKNVRQDTGPAKDLPESPQKWLQVNLSTVGNSGRTLIGTEVRVTGYGIYRTQTVSGGGYRGGQSANQMIFGLGDLPDSTVTVTVTYPSREVDIISTPVNTVVSAVENAPVVIKPSVKNDPEPDFWYYALPGSLDWVFRWRTVGTKGDLTKDVVHLQNFASYEQGDPCYVGIPPGETLDLKWGDPGVEHDVYWDGAYWQHEVRWVGLPCQTDCTYRFSVSSGLGDGTTTASGTVSTVPIHYCLPEE